MPRTVEIISLFLPASAIKGSVKPAILALLGLICVPSLVADEAIHFAIELSGDKVRCSHVPPGYITTCEGIPCPSGRTTRGTMELRGTNLSYRIAFDSGGLWFPSVRGPAGPDDRGEAIFFLNGCDDPYATNACVSEGTIAISEAQVSELLAGLWYVLAQNVVARDNRFAPCAIRGQILPVDSDQDGVPDYQDACPATPPGSTVNSDGCSIEQLCPCTGPWQHHGQYIRCVQEASKEFSREGLITTSERRRLANDAAKSDCGSHQ